MRYNETRIRTHNTKDLYLVKGTLKKRILFCFFILIFCAVIKFYPNENLSFIKSSIGYIVNHNTDVTGEFNKFINHFKNDSSLESLNPVSRMIAPSKGSIVKGFGMQDASGSDFHYGISLSAEENENIVSANDGIVSEISKSEEYGSYIVISHNEEIKTLYGNLNEIIINIGDNVEKGQAIARVNPDTKSFYFELKRGETYLDPTQFISFEE